jgi:tetratricopeptide (TPR) repeat protein
MANWLNRLLGRKQDLRLITIRDAGAAQGIHVQTPMSVAGLRRAEATACQACGGALEDVLVTTGGPEGDAELWHERPIAVDGFRCTRCAALLMPRFLEPEEMQQLQEEALAHAQAGRLDEAELSFRRICNSWPRYAPARLNLAALYVLRLDAEEEGEARPTFMTRHLDTAEAHLRDALRGEMIPLAMVADKLVRVLLRREALGQATELLDQLSAGERPEEERKALAELRRYVSTRADLYERGAAAVKNRLVLSGVPWQAPDEHGRRRLQNGVDCLLRHQRASPDSWPALWLAGKALQALGDNEGAVRELARAFAIKPDHADVGREYVSVLLDLGRAAEAEPIARAACAARPSDAGLVANLALTLLLAGKPDEAAAAVERALTMDPNDKITAEVARIINDVRTGRRPAPRSLQELQGR